MTATLDDRVTILEGKMAMLEANPQPGQNEAFSDSFKEVRTDVKELRKDFKEFGDVQGHHTLALTKLDSDVATLKTDVAGLKTDVTGLKTDVSILKTDMVEVKGTLAEILDRLPPKAA